MGVLRFHVLSLFPELFRDFSQYGLLRRALEQGQIALEATQLRDFAINTHGQVDDTPFGGGSGMVLRCETAFAAIEHVKSLGKKVRTIAFSPRGKRLTQKLAARLTNEALSNDETLLLLCPRYEGVDQRVLDHAIDLELSIGDYVLMGGESAACVVVETLSRLVPDVLGNSESAVDESFSGPFLEYPQYTKPQQFRDLNVPQELLSGNHAQISDWRREQSRADTLERRPELLDEIPAATCPISVALIHYPVHNKRGDVVTSSITNIDLHDIARSARTYGIERFYVVHPVRILRRLCEKICVHWESGYGSIYNPNRSEALSLISLVPDFNDVLLDLEMRHKQPPRVISTSAKPGEIMTSYTRMRAELRSTAQPHVILFGTGWGMAEEILEQCHARLEPIVGPTDYNHLSVRAAAAIIFDRLLQSKMESE